MRYESIFHYTCLKPKCVIRNVLAAELYDAVLAFDYTSTLGPTLVKIFCQTLATTMYIDKNHFYYFTETLEAATGKKCFSLTCG